MKFIISSILSILLLSTGACEGGKASKGKEISQKEESKSRGMDDKEVLTAAEFPYDLKEPEWAVDLPSVLQEVSGLASISMTEIAMVQDEQGLIFIMNTDSKEIISKHRFRRNGDFEGIEILGETAYVLRSDGDVYEVNNYRSDSPVAESHETALSTSNDTEGLGYDPETRLLLISSKESDKLMGIKYKDKQVIVSWDPETRSLRPNPFLVIDLDDIKKFLKKNAKSKSEKKFADKFNPDKTSHFKPSAIAVHPITKEIYLLASNGNMLLVVNRLQQITQAKHLSSKKFPQPEGMCFDEEGNLYISNEGSLGPGTLRKYTYLGKEG